MLSTSNLAYQKYKLAITWILLKIKYFSSLFLIVIQLNAIEQNIFCWCEWDK